MLLSYTNKKCAVEMADLRLLVTAHVAPSSVQSLYFAFCALYKHVAAVDPKNIPQTGINLT